MMTFFSVPVLCTEIPCGEGIHLSGLNFLLVVCVLHLVSTLFDDVILLTNRCRNAQKEFLDKYESLTELSFRGQQSTLFCSKPP